MTRSLKFRNRQHNRYWWYRLRDSQYVPPVFRLLSDQEWELLDEWFYDTEQKYGSPGEVGIPGFSLLSGIVGGNGIKRIVQCGHYVGFSTLLLGFLMRGMGFKHSIFSVDIDPHVTEYTQGWLERADLLEYVLLEVGDSADSQSAKNASEWLQGPPQCIFVDSSHQYAHTIKELDLWYEQLPVGGLILLHDVSTFAKQFDSTQSGGVPRAVLEWSRRTGVPALLINNSVDGTGDPNHLTYKDGCGMGIVQKI